MAYFNVDGYNSYSGCDIIVTATLPSINGDSAGKKVYTLGSLQTLSISTHQDKRPVRSLGYINARDYVMGPRTIAGSMVFAVFNKHFASEMMADLGASGSSVVLPDEIPALNITVNFANEYGRKSRMAIYGVKIINEGQVMSINDLYTENTYQFVALGLEPLNVNISSTDDVNTMKPSVIREYEKANSNNIYTGNNYNRTDVIISETAERADALLDNINFNSNSGQNLVSQIQNNSYKNNTLYNEDSMLNSSGVIVLKVKAEHAKDESNMGMTTFTLAPKQTHGIIYIYRYENLNNSVYSLNIEGKNNYIISIPAGSYTAQFISGSNESSNIVSFYINEYYDYNADDYNKIYPIVEKVTHNSISVSSNDYTHNKVFYYKQGDSIINSLDIGKSYIVLPDLLSNTEYCIYTKSNKAKSETITVKTHSIENEEIETLIQFIKDNQRLLASDYENLISMISTIDTIYYNNLLDSILSLPESIQKQELLIYANKLANNFTVSYNSFNENLIVNDINDSPFDSVIKVDGYKQANFYNVYNNRVLLSKSINPTEEKFYAVPNKHYFVQGVDNGIKSVKTDFVVCRNNAYSSLQRYNDFDNYKKINLDSYLNQYSKYSYNMVESLAIKNNFFSDIELLAPPYIYQNETNDIYANVNYYDLKPNTTYYLSFIELHNALDYVPVRKIPFTNNTEEIILKNHYPGMIRGRKYLFWIESNDYIKLSKPELFIYNHTNEFLEYNEIYEKETSLLLNDIKVEFLKRYSNKTVIDELFNYVYDIRPNHKDIIYILIINLIRIFGASIYVSDVMRPLFELINIAYKQTDLAQLDYSIEINTSRNILKVNKPENFYICALHINDSITVLESFDNMVSFPTDGYTLVYIISDSMIFKSDFVLIDNKTCKTLCSNNMSHYVKKVGDE